MNDIINNQNTDLTEKNLIITEQTSEIVALQRENEEVSNKVVEMEIGFDAHQKVVLEAYNKILEDLHRQVEDDLTLGNRIARIGRNKFKK